MGTVTILNASDLAALGDIEVTNVSIYQKINDKYTLDFTAYEQPFIDLLATGVYINIFIKKENGQDVTDIFTLNEIRHNPVEGRYDVSCEHISYDLNRFTRTDETGIEEFTYSGTTGQIVTEILGLGSRFSFIPSDNVPGTFEFKTKTVGRRSRIIEFCKQEGFEVFWRNFNVAIQLRRGIDDGLSIELGSNLRGLEVNTTFNFDQTTTTTFNIDFVDLNAVLDDQGEPLAPGSFDMGDYVTVRYNGQSYYQRVIAVKYNPFVRALPTVELENPVHDILEVIADTNNRPPQDNGGGGEVTGSSLNIIKFQYSETFALNGLFSLEFVDAVNNIDRYQYDSFENVSGGVFSKNGDGYAVVNISKVTITEYVAKGQGLGDVYLKFFPYFVEGGYQEQLAAEKYYKPIYSRIVDDSNPISDIYEVVFGPETFEIRLNDENGDYFNLRTFGIELRYVGEDYIENKYSFEYSVDGHILGPLNIISGEI